MFFPRVQILSMFVRHRNNKLHSEIAIQSPSRNKNCTVEKPLALTVEECGRISSAMGQSSERLFPLQTYSFIPATIGAESIVKSGAIGRFVNATIMSLLFSVLGYLDARTY